MFFLSPVNWKLYPNSVKVEYVEQRTAAETEQQFYAWKTGSWLDLVEMRWQVCLWPVTNTTLTGYCCPAERFMWEY